jgi:DNA-binding MarR family transcriptional regulator
MSSEWTIRSVVSWCTVQAPSPAVSPERPRCTRPARSGIVASAAAGATTIRSDADRFADAWDEFVVALRRSQARGQTAREDPTLAQHYLLVQLKGEVGRPLWQLAQGAGIAAPTATCLVDGLERAGLVKRRRRQRDCRSVLVSLTKAGARALRRKHAQIARRRRMIYERPEPEERGHSERLLHYLTEIMDRL